MTPLSIWMMWFSLWTGKPAIKKRKMQSAMTEPSTATFIITGAAAATATPALLEQREQR